jgi:hypothetical protein
MITDIQVIQAYIKYHNLSEVDNTKMVYDYLAEMTGHSEGVCFEAMEGLDHKGFIDYGVSLRMGWITEEGYKAYKNEIESFMSENGYKKIRTDFDFSRE